MKEIVLVVLTCCANSFAQHFIPAASFNAIAGEFSGEQAQEYTRQIIQYHRIQGSPMMAEVAQRVVLPALKAAGLEARIEQFPSDGKRKYGTFISPMGWEIRSGELWVESVAGEKDFQPVRLCRYEDVPMCISTYSKGGEWSGELVEVGKGTSDSDYASKDVKDKVALASGYAANVVRQAVLQHGAAGVVIYPAAEDRPDHPDMVRYNGIWPRAEELAKTSGGFQISRNQYDQLRGWIQKGAVRVRGKIDATLGPGQLTLVHAYIRGSEHPEREVLLTAHLDHPKWSANDNASGSAAMLEAARALQALIAAKKIAPPRLTLHFMWVPEYFGTLAFVSKHPEARRCGEWDDARAPRGNQTAPPVEWNAQPCVLANLNLDMVGEDTVKTNSRFYFTRTPDSVPSFLNSLMADVTEQTREADLYAPTGTRNYWQPEAIDYVRGSDHDVLLGLGVPATMLGHDPDWTHHTSEDKLDKTDASEFRRTGTLAAAVAWFVAAASNEDWRRLWLSMVASLQSERLARAQDLLAEPSPQRAHARYDLNTSEIGRLSESFAAEFQTDRANSDAQRYQMPIQLETQSHGNRVPHRTALTPFDASAFENLTGDDKQWWDEQQARLASDAQLLPTKPTFDLLVFETVNFMDGRRTTAQISDLLSAEFPLELDETWVNRLLGILEKQGLAAER